MPGSTDVAIFDGTNSKNALINANANVAGVAMNVGYTGTITQGAGFTLTVGSSSFSQGAGTFQGGTANITLNGGFSLSGGSFTATSATLTVTGDFTHSAGGLFLHNSGTVSFATSTATVDVAVSEAFYNVTFASGTTPTSATGAKSLCNLLKAGVGHQKVFTTNAEASSRLLTRTG